VLLHVRLGSFVGVMPSVKRVSPCGVCMMGRFFVVSGLMMLSCFAVVTRGMRMVLCRLLMVLTARRSLPVCPRKQTISEPAGTSRLCQNRK
jgi:hypothetical protein